jgi:hypothetical protein
VNVPDPVLALQVVFRPAGGADPDAPITAATLAAHAPDPSCVEAASTYLRRHGFEVGPLTGISVTATAPRSVVERTWGTRLRLDEASDGSALAATSSSGDPELPVDALPPDARAGVRAITFGRPPAFGPGTAG